MYQAIAWGTMNRVRLGEASAAMRQRYGAGVSGVIFKRGQFNPALSVRSPFSRDFLCPRDPTSWRQALDAARIALQGQDNPFIQTDWERRHGLSLVVNFYYPRSAQAVSYTHLDVYKRQLLSLAAAASTNPAAPAHATSWSPGWAQGRWPRIIASEFQPV